MKFFLGLNTQGVDGDRRPWDVWWSFLSQKVFLSSRITKSSMWPLGSTCARNSMPPGSFQAWNRQYPRAQKDVALGLEAKDFEERP